LNLNNLYVCMLINLSLFFVKFLEIMNENKGFCSIKGRTNER